MNYQAPKTLCADEAYAVVAYLLDLNGNIGDKAHVSEDTLTKVRMPNRDGFVPDAKFSQMAPSHHKTDSDR